MLIFDPVGYLRVTGSCLAREHLMRSGRGARLPTALRHGRGGHPRRDTNLASATNWLPPAAGCYQLGRQIVCATVPYLRDTLAAPTAPHGGNRTLEATAPAGPRIGSREARL